MTNILAVGPLPPPLGGASMTFQIFCEEAKRYEEIEKLTIINSSAKALKPRSHVIAIESLVRATRIFAKFCKHIARVDIVIVFCTYGFLLSLGPLLLVVAKLARKPCFVRISGGALDNCYEQLSLILRWFFISTLRYFDGVIVQTQWLYEYFSALLEKVYMIPGYRYIPEDCVATSVDLMTAQKTLRLVYLGHIKEEKGVFVLLDSLELIVEHNLPGICCDIYGPVYSGDEGHFFDRLANLPSVSYRGIVQPNQVISTLKSYDALIFPTYYPNEGHPGVLIEAMIAGIPAITTCFRSIPEIVQENINGLLVPPQDALALTQAILTLYENPELLEKLKANSCITSRKYDARKLVPIILGLLDVNIVVDSI